MKADISRTSFDRAKHYAAVIQQQGRVQLDADWNEQTAIARYHAEAALRDLIGPHGAPVNTAGFGLTTGPAKDDGSSGDVLLGAGHYYVDGILCENDADVPFTAQPFLPGTPLPTGNALLYLEVWRRLVTPLDDPSIRETALGEADTSVRLQTVWQVKSAPADEVTILPTGLPSNWDTLTAAPTGRMKATVHDVRADETAATILLMGGFESLENQLYRVEVHTGGDLSTAVFKWSRDNGVVTTTVNTFAGHTLYVTGLGRDAALGFAAGQWVEITSAADELVGRPGRLARVADVDEGLLQMVLEDTADLSGLDPAQNLRLRRWDGVLPLTEEARTANPLTATTALEAGVSVLFEDGTFRPGDYWLIPARAANATIEWPPDASLPPHGIQRHYAPLALVSNPQGTLNVTNDLRRLFPALTAVTSGPKALHLTSVTIGDPKVRTAQTIQNFYKYGLFFDFSEAIAGFAPNDGSFEITLEQVSSDLSSTVTRLHGSMTISRDRVVWVPRSTQLIHPPVLSVASETNVAGVAPVAANPYIVRITLHGSMIWSADGNPPRYLDGTTFRSDDGYKFPSGIGVAASDFNAFLVLNTAGTS